jgi:hypothetical protein
MQDPTRQSWGPYLTVDHWARSLLPLFWTTLLIFHAAGRTDHGQIRLRACRQGASKCTDLELISSKAGFGERACAQSIACRKD